jgi:hypothetical protein
MKNSFYTGLMLIAGLATAGEKPSVDEITFSGDIRFCLLKGDQRMIV